eukprot:Gregarina_sp_Pseudo_9__537@NODE_1347_length_1671_cov_4_926471_g1258_i0_p1_GENE_NODE_1347_length_1671_cov_4_926471_g1258_i0NODE_1347_length_1671_cov_4_926471_g1258_i0_p1_ORF_typecomplete_len458_score137_97LUC7/PF03194_15/5_8e75FdhE/PF04216_12/0_0011ZnC2H2_12/PF18112_1/1e04ZnC2H2_12/PF18112_1/0_053KMP11/PF03037_16/0_04KMP11/PF03037_16/3_4e03DUF4407/PF14362_6/0_31Vps53_N/PF04100_12/0_47LPP/PF04728_13/32LPP/PF04728_13/17CAMSAP_CC1/PF17095_5/5_2e02CAMSAP_CC1/PF17095_5/0_37DUF1811/PF08838_10/5_8e03DUF
MDEMRALLDSLLGVDRNALPEQRQNRQQRFNDSDVCRYFLVDFCPHDLFPNTRSDLGPCPKIHNDSLKEQYQSSPDKEAFAVEYEAEFISFLEKLIEQAEQKIEKANRRIDAPLPDNALLSEEQQQQVDKLNEEISRLLGEAEKAGERGDVEEAAVITRQVQQLRREADRAASSLYGSYMQREKSLRVCPICGAMQSVGDSMSRFESHVTGKQHQGFEKIRSCLEELKRRRAERQKQRSAAEAGRDADRQGGDGYRQGGDGYRQGGDGYRQGGDGYRQGGDGAYRSSRGGDGYRSRAPRFQQEDNRRAKRPRWSEGDGWAGGEGGGDGDGRRYYRQRHDARSPSPQSGRRDLRRYGDGDAAGSRGGSGGYRSSYESSGRRPRDGDGQRGVSRSSRGGRVVRSAAAAQLDSGTRSRPSDDGEPEEGEYFGGAIADKTEGGDRSCSTAESERGGGGSRQ